jgi:hypothetical protein
MTLIDKNDKAALETKMALKNVIEEGVAAGYRLMRYCVTQKSRSASPACSSRS